MRIAQGHADIFVAEKVLHGFQVYAVHHQLAGEGVAEVVEEVVEAEVFDAGFPTGGVEGAL
jgi:hypothetical protein